MDTCSYFIPNKALFGCYPTQNDVEELEQNGVRYFIDLTCQGEKRIVEYHTKYNYFNFPIRDHKTPHDWKDFAVFIISICNLIRKLPSKELIYVHCRAGHGRSGMVVACILCYLYKMLPDHALHLTNEYHKKRKEMKDKRRRMGSPSNSWQKEFVQRFFRPLYFYKAAKIGIKEGLSTFSLHPIKVPDFGTFPTLEAALQAYKDPTNKEYVKLQENSITPYMSKHIGKECLLRKDWEEVREQIMLKLLELKFTQHLDIQYKLLHTGLRPIIHHCLDHYWGNGKDGCGKNVLGKLLVKLRYRLYTKNFF